MAKTNRNALLVWLVLCLLTVATYAVGKVGLGGISIILLLLLSISVKGQLVADYFMGLKHIQSRWRWVVTGWLLSVVSLIGVAYWLGEH